MKPRLTINDLSAYLQISKPTIYKMIEENKIPHIRINQRLIRFDPDDIEKYLRDKKQEIA